MSQLEWEVEFRRRLVEAEHEYELLHAELGEDFLDVTSLAQEGEEAFETGIVKIQEDEEAEEAEEVEAEVNAPLYNFVSWISAAIFPESCFSREKSCWIAKGQGSEDQQPCWIARSRFGWWLDTCFAFEAH